MKIKLVLVFIALIFTKVGFAQSHWDTAYVKDYTKRILWAYFQEYKSIAMEITPSEELDPNGTETLLLNSSNNLYSGILIQYKGISLYLAGNLPQSEEDKEEFGPQESNVWKFNIQLPAAGLRMHNVNYSGFYDANYEEHEFAPSEDPNQYQRYSKMETSWFGADLKYYPAYRRFAQGMPENFNLHQIRSKFATGYRIGYNRVLADNHGTALFAPTLQNRDSVLGVNKLRYSGMNFSVGPSVYLAGRSGFFLYADIWLGLDGGRYALEGDKYAEETFRVSVAVPELRIATGYQSEKWLAALYYMFQNQSFDNDLLMVSSTLHTFGIILGFRTNSPSRLIF